MVVVEEEESILFQSVEFKAKIFTFFFKKKINRIILNGTDLIFWWRRWGW